MEKNKTKQICIYQFNHPFDIMQTILKRNDTLEAICAKEDFKIKKFIGSDWLIQDSGFIFYGPNNLNVTFTLKSVEKNDFNRVTLYRITYLQGNEFNNKIEVMTSLIRNTADNSTIMEFRIYYNSAFDLDNLQKYVKLSKIKEYIMKIYYKINKLFFETIDKNKTLIINHSFIINKNYKDVFNYFYNWDNLIKSIKAEEIWQLINENDAENDKEYKDFDIIINKKIKVHYHIISLEEIEKEKIEIIYNKTTDSIPALNNYIKFSFFNISKNLCFFLYETHLPANITSSIYQTISFYLYFCNIKLKEFIENNAKIKIFSTAN